KPHCLVLGGGVSANQKLRESLKRMAENLGISDILLPPSGYSMDNGAMIAYAGCLRLSAGEEEGLSVEVYPRWPLDSLSII
ncbi:MAG: tRNA (adenosine(37)-N6)-threonylcarbamoyltransferase complex transferase subunit TsaD, partial [Thermodesulfobacteriota bacterium]